MARLSLCAQLLMTLCLLHFVVVNQAFGNPASISLFRQKPQQKVESNSQVADMIAASVLRFGINVGNQLDENINTSKCEVFSPLSVMSALALLFAGARGKSYQQMKPIFGFDLNTPLSNERNLGQMLHREFGLLLKDIEQESLGAMHQRPNAKWRETPQPQSIRRGTVQLSPVVQIVKVANGLFAQNGYNIIPTYRNVIESIYSTEMMQLDFQHDGEAARQHINSWVNKNTFGKIPSIINNPTPHDTNMILASVLYFKAFWENTFLAGVTRLEDFYPEGEERPSIKVPMMFTAGLFPYYEAPEYDCNIIGLPYRGDLSTMYVIQPRHSSRAKLKDFQSKITPEAIEEMISKMTYRSAMMAFPKLHLVRQLNLKEILQKFGVFDIFSSATSDLSLIGGSKSSQALNNVLPTNIMDRFNEQPLFFSSRFGDIGNMTTKTKQSSEKVRSKRQSQNDMGLLNLLEEERLGAGSSQSDLYVGDILHKVDFEVNEQGTEAAAATVALLLKTGAEVNFRCDTPFMLLLRHDPTKLVLFYATVNEPEI